MTYGVNTLLWLSLTKNNENTRCACYPRRTSKSTTISTRLGPPYVPTRPETSSRGWSPSWRRWLDQLGQIFFLLPTPKFILYGGMLAVPLSSFFLFYTYYVSCWLVWSWRTVDYCLFLLLWSMVPVCNSHEVIQLFFSFFHQKIYTAKTLLSGIDNTTARGGGGIIELINEIYLK